MRKTFLTAVLLTAGVVPGAARSVEAAPVATAPTETRRVLTLDAARAVAEVAEGEARRNKAGGAIAVVDDGGHLVCLIRLDDTFPAAANISIAKARSAAIFRRPTSVFEEAIGKGRLSLVANDELLPLQGGVPIVVDGRVIGAVGVAGAASAAQDDEIAKIAASAVK